MTSAARTIFVFTDFKVLLCCVMFSAFLLPTLHASAIGTGSILVTDLAISPVTGTVVFIDPWTAEAYSEAKNSLCGCDSQFSSSLGGLAQASAAVLFADAHSAADASALNLFASAEANVPGGLMAASAIGEATLFNTSFSITGGSGQVEVTFSAMLELMQSLFTDASGTSALSDASFGLSLDGQNLLFMDSFNQVGPNSSWQNSFSGELSNTVTLNFDQTYTLYAVVETDPQVSNVPEPGTGLLLLLGVPVLMSQITRLLRCNHG